MATFYLPSSAGWASQKASWGTSAAGRGHLRLNCERSYDRDTNKSTLTFSVWGYSEYYEASFQANEGDTIKVNGSAVATFHDAGGNGTHKLNVFRDTSWRQLSSVNGPNTWSVTLSHDASGALSAQIQLNLTLFSTVNGVTYVMRWTDSYTYTATEPRGSTISSVTNPATTQGTLTVNVNRASSAFYHKAKVKKGSTVLTTTGAFATSTSISVPRSWFTNYPSDASLACTVEVQTYTDSSCTTAIGDPATASVTVKADSGMKPLLQAGYASAAPYNTGTAAAGITGYVSGVSKAKVTLDSSKLTMAEGANVASIKVAGGGVEDTTQPYITGVLAGTATITVTVTDSRGRSGTQTLTVTCMPYASPTLSQVTVFRCDSLGDADEDGTYISAQATGGVSSLNGQNSLTLTAAWAQGGGSYGAENALTSGSTRILGGTLDPDQKLEVRITAKDSLNTEAFTVVLLPPRVWAMKFRPNGLGVGFGMAPTEDRVLQLPAGWKIKIGDTVVAQ